jgi:hypothetical protein
MSALRCPAAVRWCCWLLLLPLAGCKTAPYTGPVYKLHAPEEQALTTPVAVSVTDARPANERKYQAGAVQPCEYRNGVETLTLENFEPNVTELLKQTFQQRLSILPTPPVWADVEVTRFRAQIDRREVLAAEYEQQLEADRAGSAIDVGFGLASGAGPGGIAGGLMAAANANSALKQLDSDRSSWDHAMAGVNCEIQIRVQLHWNDNHRETFTLDAKSHSYPDDELLVMSERMKWNIAPTVEKAIAQLGDDLHIQAAMIRPKGSRHAEAPELE